jgi:hypothetical protein
MPFKKGNPGKPKGAKSAKTRTVEETAERVGVDLFEVLCMFAKGDWKGLGYEDEKETKFTSAGIEFEEYRIKPDLRLHAAKEACKYLYSQKRAVELTNPDGTGFKIIVEDYSKK